MSISLIPDSAPFSPEQRAWLNGFIAGWTGLMEDAAIDGSVNGVAAGLMPGGTATLVESSSGSGEEEFPWHDPALELEERLELAEGKPLDRKLMAAMAQLDCGACGYICQTYSEAIAAGEEKNLTLCSPGGKPTAKKLKQLLRAEKESPTSTQANNAGSSPITPSSNGSTNGYSRNNPYRAAIATCENLNRPGSSKQTSHVEIKLDGSGLEYEVGDALGVYPRNCSDLVSDVLDCLGAEGDEQLKRQLTEAYCLRTATDELIERLAELASDSTEKQKLLGLIDSDDLDNMDVLDILRIASSAEITPEQFITYLQPIAPRLYSIASSQKAHPGEVHLTVGRAEFQSNGRIYKGVASTMFADRVVPGDHVGVYVHKSHGFTVPADPRAPMIMVGPGTGIAPFRAFLEERQATGAEGENWLFFGDQHAATDYLYEDQLNSLKESGVLNRVSLAFSRDQDEKIYVQTKMREEGAELFAWLEKGGYFFVCGDARRMAVDVDRALHDLIAQHGGMSEREAQAYVQQLKTDGRYMRDVY